MSPEDTRALSFETLFTDPLIRLVMESDGVTTCEMVEVLEVARDARARRKPLSLRDAVVAGTA